MVMLKVECITEAADGSGWIEAVGGEDFYHTAEAAIRNIRQNVHTYYTVADGNVALIDVRQIPVSGRPCLQVIARNYSSGNLPYHLPGCEQRRVAHG